MHQPLHHQTPGPPGYVYGTICRINFWVKMTTALGITQIVIGISCMVFYMIAFFTNLTMEHFVRYMAVGIVTGTVILAAGIMGMVCSKKKTKCTISGFLILSALSAMFAMFPMVLGIVGATTSMLEEDSLMIPICQLVFATVEIVVATWSIGVCCQAICCPNATFGQVSTRMPSGIGFTQFISGGDGQHVVVFTSSPSAPSTFTYNMNNTQQPYLLQQGVPTIQVTAQPGIMCAVGQNGITRPPHYYSAYSGMQHPSECVLPQSEPAVVVSGTMTATPEEALEDEKLLHYKENVKSSPVGAEPVQPTVTEPIDTTYEVEDEAAHLLC